MVAWSKVDKAVRQVGPYASVVFDDALIQRVLQDMGGWVLLNTKPDSEWPFVGNEFRTRYHGYRSRGEQPEYPKVLIGIAEAENVSKGRPAPDPVLIGDQMTAALVAKGGSEQPAPMFHRLELTKTLAPEKVH
jgi:hypothetical protein